MCCNCQTTDQRAGHDVPISAGMNEVKFYNPCGQPYGFRTANYALSLSAQDVAQYGINNVKKYSDRFTFDSGNDGKIDYTATETLINYK